MGQRSGLCSLCFVQHPPKWVLRIYSIASFVFAHVVGTAPWNMHVFALPCSWNTGWGGVGMMTFLALAHMFDATQQGVSLGLAHMFDATQQDVSCGGGVGWGGDDDVPCTCTHVWCYATGCLSRTCTHVWCYATGCFSRTCTHVWCYATGCFLWGWGGVGWGWWRSLHLHTCLMLRNRMFLSDLHTCLMLCNRMFLSDLHTCLMLRNRMFLSDLHTCLILRNRMFLSDLHTCLMLPPGK